MDKRRQPKYQRIYSDIKNKISEKIYPQGCFLPSERSMCEEYSVERVTVRHALDLLVNEGIVEKVPGSGSRVAQQSKMIYTVTEGKNIAFVLPKGIDKITSPYISEVFYNFEKECRKHGFNLLYTNIRTDDTVTLESIAKSSEITVFFGCVGKQIIEYAKKLRLKYVLVSDTDSESISVVIDNISGISNAVRYLKSLGHKNIAFINGKSSHYNDSERYRGFVSSMFGESLPVNDSLMRECKGTFDSGYQCSIELCRDNCEFTALVAANDMIAFGAMKAFMSLGFKVPDDISVIGFDNTEQCSYSTPSLTSVGADSENFAHRIMLACLEVADNSGHGAVKYSVIPELFVRESTSKAK